MTAYFRVAVLAVLIFTALAAPGLANAALSVTRAELKGSQLRVEGQGTAANARITIDGTLRGRADSGGRFRVEFSPFSSPTCRVTVGDGVTSVSARLSGCTA